MTRKALMEKSMREPKFKVRQRNRCPLCGRPRSYIRHFDMCRICFRDLSSHGKVPGVRKSSW
ncbi:MAG: type Z 30S ribosomal protein S14 [Candidatus Dadabacteria bacterium]|jgi:small subunit ribosomal protein S14|nr:type Z 30S ribosomal protein S14 [Candidatus Dadabacteria bacterium]